MGLKNNACYETIFSSLVDNFYPELPVSQAEKGAVL